MSSIVIKVEDLSKQYRLGQIGTGSINHDINRWWHKLRGKEDPYLRIGEENDRSNKGVSEYVWALKDINFEVKQGEVLGIIGRNGAGKSTLLKLLSRTTAPTKGQVKIKGRVASLLEVGTGFHPDLSGRDNIFLNGAILGMTKSEIQSKFDEIVDFAGVERYIDTPVKRYSSGMYVRLAFAVAAYLEPEILIVDEVLAVGDAEFQKKCLGKMKDVSVNDGRTVLFVSHNMSAIQKLCDRGLLMKNGMLLHEGPMASVIDKYLQIGSRKSVVAIPENTFLPACILRAEVRDENNEVVSEIPIGGKWKIAVRYKVNNKIKNFISAIGIVNSMEAPLKSSWQDPIDIEPGEYEAVFTEDIINLAMGQYKVCLGLSQGSSSIQYFENILSFDIISVVDELSSSVIKYDGGSGVILNPMKMTTKKIS